MICLGLIASCHQRIVHFALIAVSVKRRFSFLYVQRKATRLSQRVKFRAVSAFGKTTKEVLSDLIFKNVTHLSLGVDFSLEINCCM